MEKIDTILGNLMDGLYTRDLHQCVNLMIVSDHGEVAVPFKRHNLKKYNHNIRINKEVVLKIQAHDSNKDRKYMSCMTEKRFH